MQLSKSSIRTQKNIPADESSKNAELLIRAGYIHKEMAGVYTQLPLGYKVVQNIMQIIREEMNAVGAEEMFMPTLQDLDVWKKTGRGIDNPDIDAWFSTELKNGTKLGLGFTHEENITNVFKRIINSYKDIPLMAYQFQNKFRNETRAKSGIMRTREFIMKDLYSFCRDNKEHAVVYEKLKQAYVRIFNRLGLGEYTYITFASGGVFAKYSHEFQTICEAGEDDIYIYDNIKNTNGIRLAINKEVFNSEVLNDLSKEYSLDFKEEDFFVKRASEVGNIFSLGTRFSDALDLKFKDENGEEKSVVMGSYGIGPARVMGVITEIMSDDKGLVWSHEVAPYQIHLTSLHKEEGDNVYNFTKDIYDKLQKSGVEVLWDDRLGKSAGEKFADADLIGIPVRVLVSEKTIVENMVEIKYRKADSNGNRHEERLEKEVFLNSYTTKNCD